MAPITGRERVLILVKALPHAGEKHGETVCCAGVTVDRQWRRQYPIHFRTLQDEQKFKRWHWVEYEWRRPRDDQRPESRRVQESSIALGKEMPRGERATFLEPLFVDSMEAAAAEGKTLALVRPQDVRFSWKRKRAGEIAQEKAKYETVAKQFSMFEATVDAFEPCPFKFKFDYATADGVEHSSTCDDWETAAMFRNFGRRYGEDEALAKMSDTFSKTYPQAGMAFAMGTHSRYPKVWLLVGVLRVDRITQAQLFA